MYKSFALSTTDKILFLVSSYAIFKSFPLWASMTLAPGVIC